MKRRLCNASLSLPAAGILTVNIKIYLFPFSTLLKVTANLRIRDSNSSDGLPSAETPRQLKDEWSGSHPKNSSF